jgi:hypothetical protein
VVPPIGATAFFAEAALVWSRLDNLIVRLADCQGISPLFSCISADTPADISFLYQPLAIRVFTDLFQNLNLDQKRFPQ